MARGEKSAGKNVILRISRRERLIAPSRTNDNRAWFSQLCGLIHAVVIHESAIARARYRAPVAPREARSRRDFAPRFSHFPRIRQAARHPFGGWKADPRESSITLPAAFHLGPGESIPVDSIIAAGSSAGIAGTSRGIARGSKDKINKRRRWRKREREREGGGLPVEAGNDSLLSDGQLA